MSSFNEANVVKIAEKLSLATSNVDRVFESGRSVGIGEGYQNGHGDGYRAGRSDGLSEGHEQGYYEGYSAGKADGYEEGCEDGYGDGRKAEYDAFWDAYMPEGLKQWQYIFYSNRWNDKNFYPKRDIKPIGAATFAFSTHTISNFKQRLIDCGVTLDTSGVTEGNYMFCFCSALTNLPTISFVGLRSQIQYTFADDRKLKEIEKIILKDDGSTTFENWFRECYALTDITFEGVIGQSIDFQWSTKLTRASIESIITCLEGNQYDLGKTITLSKTAVDESFRGISAGDLTTIVDGSYTVDWFTWSRIAINKGWTIKLV